MKRSGLHNGFDKGQLIRWFCDNYECWTCGKNHIDCFHHIVGRGNGDSDCESSIFNAAPLNNFNCHLPIHGVLRKDENVAIFLQKTMKYLLSQKYEFNEKDKQFILKYMKYYNKKCG